MTADLNRSSDFGACEPRKEVAFRMPFSPQIRETGNPEFAVALVAVASNESAYVAEWVAHHLYFGFSPIEIYVNRSDDATENISRQIASLVPDLRIENVDHLDQGKHPAKCIQYSSYGQALHRLSRSLNRSDYIMFLDIDEFWTPRDLRSTVQVVLESAGMPSLAAFNWFIALSDIEPFSATITPLLEGIHHTNVKSAFNAKLRLRARTPHSVTPIWPRPTWSSSGAGFASGARDATRTTPKSFGDGFVIHRYYRSQMEYLALLGRGRPKDKSLVFKNNRNGFHAGRKSDPRRDVFRPPADAYLAYCQDLKAQLAEFDIQEFTPSAQESVRLRAARVLSNFQAMSPDEQANWSYLFTYIDLKSLS